MGRSRVGFYRLSSEHLHDSGLLIWFSVAEASASCCLSSSSKRPSSPSRGAWHGSPKHSRTRLPQIFTRRTAPTPPGAVDQKTATKAQLKPYLKMVKARMAKSPENVAWVTLMMLTIEPRTFDLTRRSAYSSPGVSCTSASAGATVGNG
jgi:hypothetical protein